MRYLILAFGFLTCLNAAEVAQPQEIRIYLNTQSVLTPVYLSKLKSDDGSLDKSYLEQLEAVFQFDLSYNGSTCVASYNPQKENAPLQPSAWKDSGVLHVVRAAVSNKTLTASIFSVQNGSLKQFPEIALTGQLSKDRRQIHKVVDGIHKALFGVDGVASSRVLYSAQVKLQSSAKGDWVSEIWSCDWDGANARQLTKEGSYCVTPVFIPPSAKFANDRFLYVSYKMGQPKIYIASLSEGIGKRLIDLKGNQLLPAISPQRDKVAFICDAGGRTDLFLQTFNPDHGDVGKPVQLFSYPRSTQASPTFSPDGTRLAFVSDKDGWPAIYVIPTTFSGKRASPMLITKENRENSCPAWSPDGKKMAYSAKTKGVRQIWIYDFDAKEERQLTDGAGNKENPSWAADSMHLVFNSTDGGASELYIVNLNQPEVVKITQGPGKKHYPTWGK